MTETELRAALKGLFPDAEASQSGKSFFWFVAGDEKKLMPFMTLVMTNEHDAASDLDRTGVYRLNISLAPEAYRELFGPAPKPRADWGVLETGHDYTALNQLMPHPIYAALSWACVLNPTPDTLGQLRPLLLAAYARAQRRK